MSGLVVRAPARFTPLTRALHWVMAVLVLTVLFMGVTMVSTVSGAYAALVALHRPLGLLVLVLALVRLANRLGHAAPRLPSDMPAWQTLTAHGLHVLFYVLLIAQPLVGWGMLSAAGYPVQVWGAWHLPPILPADPGVYAQLRRLHTWLGLLLFAAFLLHLGAALFHALVRRDGVFQSMAVAWRRRTPPDAR